MCGIYSAQKRQDICQKRTDFILLHGGHKYRLGSNTVNSLPCKKKNSDESFDSSLFCLAWVNRIDTFGNSWKTGLFGVINCYQASSGQILCQNTYSFHLDYSMHKEKTQHFYFKLSFSTSPFFAGLLTLLPLPLEEFFGSTFFRVIEVFSHPAVFLVDFRNDTIG